MKDFYSVEEVQKILFNKNRETVLRYIRNSIIKDKNIIDFLLKENIITTNDVINGTAYLTVNSLEAISKEDITPKKDDSEETLSNKKILKKVASSLILEKPNTKPYRISAKSILLLLKNRFGKGELEAKKLLEEDAHESNNNSILSSSSALEDDSVCAHNNNPDSCAFCQIFNNAKSKEKFIKGLYLLECIDGDISEKEKEMISDRAARLGITEEQIKEWALDPQNLNQEEIIPLVTFREFEQRVVFIKEAILLAYQDGCYTKEEQNLIKDYAKNNDIPEQILKEFEEEIKEIILRNIGKQYVIRL